MKQRKQEEREILEWFLDPSKCPHRGCGAVGALAATLTAGLSQIFLLFYITD